jgi:hypothetical protein
VLLGSYHSAKRSSAAASPSLTNRSSTVTSRSWLPALWQAPSSGCNVAAVAAGSRKTVCNRSRVHSAVGADGGGLLSFWVKNRTAPTIIARTRATGTISLLQGGLGFSVGSGVTTGLPSVLTSALGSGLAMVRQTAPRGLARGRLLPGGPARTSAGPRNQAANSRQCGWRLVDAKPWRYHRSVFERDAGPCGSPAPDGLDAAAGGAGCVGVA